MPLLRIFGVWGMGLVLAGLPAPEAPAQWINAPGTGWVDLSLAHQDTRTRFNPSGRRQPFADNGHAITTSLFITGTYGVVQGVDVWGSLPVHRTVFNDLAGDRNRTGLGDPRVHVRFSPTPFLKGNAPVALRIGVKAPLGDFPVDAEVIPIGEGQWDVEVIGEVGHSFYPRTVYAVGWIGYRWRGLNTKIDRKPGNERWVYLALGGQARQAVWQVGVEGMQGGPPRILGFEIPTARRAWLQLWPTLGWTTTLGVVRAGVRWPLAGRNLPAGKALTVGFFTNWGG